MTRYSQRYCILFFTLTFFIMSNSFARDKPLSFEILADVDPTETIEGQALKPRLVTTFNGNIFFSNSSEDEGDELWVKAPGADPRVFVDLNPGADSARPQHIKVVGGTLYFTAIDDDGIRKLWAINQESEIELVNILMDDGTPLNILSYLEWEQNIFLLGTQTTDSNSPPKLWQYSESNGLFLLDNNIPDSLSYVELSNLFTFQGDLYAFLYSDPELEICLLRHYPAFLGTDASDIPCEALTAYEHQVQEFNGLMYITGKSQLLVFDGSSTPTPALDGDAPTGDMLLLNNALFVATKRLSDGFSGGEILPYVYRIDGSRKTLVTTPSNPYDEQAVVNIAISSNDNLLYMAETAAAHDGEIWNANHSKIFTFEPDENEFQVVYESNVYENIVEGLDFLSINGADFCLGRTYDSLYCLNKSGQIEAQFSSRPNGSSPSRLTIANGQLYFNATQYNQNGLWKLDNNSQPELLIQQSFLTTEFNSQLFLEAFNQTDRFSKINEEGNVIALNELPENIISSTFGSEHIYLLTSTYPAYQIWEFDGENSPQLVISLGRDDGQANILALGSEVYVYTSAWNDGTRYGSCNVSRYSNGEMQSLMSHEFTGSTLCKSLVINVQGNAYVYLDLYNGNGSVSSSLGVINGQGISWWWQDKAIELDTFRSVINFNDELYFCGKAESLDIDFFKTLKWNEQGSLEALTNGCFQKAVLSSLDGEPKFYGFMSGRANGLYELTVDGLEKVQGLNAEFVGTVTDIVQFGNDLVLSAKFNDESEKYGHELVKVSSTNSAVHFVASAEVIIETDGREDNISLGQSLATIDMDEGDNIRWSVNVAPEYGTLNGLPLEIFSSGETLFPDEINYSYPQAFSGNDTFQILVTDGITEALLTVTIIINPSKKSEGGSIYGFFILLLLLLLLGRKSWADGLSESEKL